MIPFDGTTRAASGGIVADHHGYGNRQERNGSWSGGYDKRDYSGGDYQNEGPKGHYNNDDHRRREYGNGGGYGYGQNGGWDYGRGVGKIKPL